MRRLQQYFLRDDGVFPNNSLPVVVCKYALTIPKIFSAAAIRRLFNRNGWGNTWKNGIYTYDHYHSITHEVLGVIRGRTMLQLGGDSGVAVLIEKGDVLLIPAGVAHRNLGKERDVICIGGYPEARDFDMNYGNPGERPRSDQNIAALPLPATDPVFGEKGCLIKAWQETEPAGNRAEKVAS